MHVVSNFTCILWCGNHLLEGWLLEVKLVETCEDNSCTCCCWYLRHYHVLSAPDGVKPPVVVSSTPYSVLVTWETPGNPNTFGALRYQLRYRQQGARYIEQVDLGDKNIEWVDLCNVSALSDNNSVIRFKKAKVFICLLAYMF